MSNHIDLFQPEQNELAVTAANVAVYVDGVLCPELEVLEVVRSGLPDFSFARLVYNPAALTEPDIKSVEHLESQLYPGAEICISRFYNASPPSVVIETCPVFIGWIETIKTGLSDMGESFEISVSDYSASLRRLTVHGRYIADINSAKLLISLDPIFNEDTCPNASASFANFNGRSCRVFTCDESSSAYWSYAEIIDYLLCVYTSAGKLKRPPLELLRLLTDNQTAAELDLTGLNVLQALHQCCQRVGLNFKFEPIVSSGQAVQAIEFYKTLTGRKVELELQPNNQRLNISKTNIASFSSSKNFWPVTNRYIGLGDSKVFEATFDLVKAWDPADESTNFDEFSPSSNPLFLQVHDVYRKWCLNESGIYSNEPYNRGPAFDFSQIFGTNNFLHHPRRFYPALTRDAQGRSLNYFLEVSYDDGDNWWQYLYAFDNLLNECGIWLSSDRLDLNTWIAILKGVLKFRITCSVISDERLSCEVADGPVAAALPVIDKVIHMPRPFKYRKVTDRSIFYSSTDPSLGEPDEADDTAALYEHLRKWAGAGSEVIETVDLQTPYLALHYSVGDQVVTAPQSRDILGLRTDSRSTAHIDEIRMDFKNQCTNLKIVRKRSRQL